MSIKALATGFVENGELRIKQTRSFLVSLTRFDGPVRVTIEKDTRSLMQNGLYWLWMRIIGCEWGWDAEDVHEHCKRKYNSRVLIHINAKTGEIVEERESESTASLPRDVFSEYMERVRRGMAVDEGVTLPSTEEEFLEYEAKRHG